MKVYAECNIVINPVIDIKPLRKRLAEINVDIFTSQGVNETAKPITLVLKGENFARVAELMTAFSQTDEVLAEKVRGSVLAPEVEGLSVEEVAAWARGNILAEMAEMRGGDECESTGLGEQNGTDQPATSATG